MGPFICLSVSEMLFLFIHFISFIQLGYLLMSCLKFCDPIFCYLLLNPSVLNVSFQLLSFCLILLTDSCFVTVLHIFLIFLYYHNILNIAIFKWIPVNTSNWLVIVFLFMINFTVLSFLSKPIVIYVWIQNTAHFQENSRGSIWWYLN